MANVKTLVEYFGSNSQVEAAQNAISEYVSRISVILGFAKKASSDIRSGFCVKMAGKQFAVTAAHYLDDADLTKVVLVSRPEHPLVHIKDPCKMAWPTND